MPAPEDASPPANGPARFRLRVYRQGRETLVAAADPELVGKTFRDGKLKLEVKEGFYGGVDSEADERQVLQELRACTIANLVGERVVFLAVRHGFVEPENILLIGGVMHAQIAVLA